MNKYFGGLFLALTTLDMGIKQYVEDTFAKREERDTAVPRLVLRKVYNRGFFLNALDKYPVVIKSVSAVLGGVIAVCDYRLFQKRRRWGTKLGMTFLSAGALSNVFDRLVRGYVIDYFGITHKNSKLSKITANLADLYILVGSLIMTIAVGKRERRLMPNYNPFIKK